MKLLKTSSSSRTIDHLSHSYFFSPPVSLSHSLSLSHTHTYSHTLSRIHTHIHIHTLTFSLCGGREYFWFHEFIFSFLILSLFIPISSCQFASFKQALLLTTNEVIQFLKPVVIVVVFPLFQHCKNFTSAVQLK